MRPIDEIIVHCTATPEGRAVSVKEIDAWHRARGWSGIGYHRVIHLDGRVETGRAMEKIGAHVAGRNSRTAGIVYVGGVAADGVTAKDTRTKAQTEALVEELRRTSALTGALRISGHRDHAAKACPSYDATAEYKGLLGRAAPVLDAMADEILERGERGPDVAAWRRDLDIWRDRIAHPWGMPDGDAFDHTVELATLHFQKTRGIVADGKVGPQTREEMELALAGKPPFQAIPEHDDDPGVLAAVAKLKGALGDLGHPA
ncbi:N-acetylmuramoyl-L-alanine amidase [Fulvimarina pelagi HTCC2506]|uniref:N-acetylmuramoyl-L-alanine amidase n=1 Tax=Fulvimarina pelagi HTCC2506 TaxID=314231 RepID=Q0FYX8_9HYPH|nr:N-acetylmuramoyl-L-alanine amidase [Fulvimarina pelagi]EAU40180.1 N-acetylmuramoyl-L-alanine amidase [Fulvimarina pelagi HTCC2506]